MIAKSRLLALVVALTFVAAACGSDSDAGDSGVSGQSADQLLSNAKSQLTHAKTVTIRGAGTDNGSKLKLNMTYSGRTAAGTVTMAGGKIRLLKSQGHAYFKGSDAFYDQAAGANASQFKALVNGRWILIDPASKDFKGFDEFVNGKTFLRGLAKQFTGTLSKGKEGRVAGIECISLRDASGTMWLNASNGTIVRLVTDDGQALNFSYRRVRPAQPPEPQDVLDLATLK
jgi:hypothetical protein